MVRFLSSDRITQWVTVLGLACAATTLAGLKSYSAVDWFNANLADPIMGVALLVAFLAGSLKLGSRIDRLFWRLWAVAFAALIATHLFRHFTDLPGRGAAGFARGLLFVVFYALVVIALELRPHLQASERRSSWMFRIETVGIVVLAIGLYIYFAVLPALFAPDSPGYAIQTSMLLIGFDVYLTLRIADSIRTSRDRIWSATYSLFLVAALSWMARDVIEVLGTLSYLEEATWQALLDLTWLPPYLAIAYAARLRDWRPVDPAVSDEMSSGELRFLRTEGTRGTLWFHAALLPVLHIVLETAGVLDPATQLAQQGCALAVFLLNGMLAVSYQRRLESENVELANEKAEAVEAARQAYHDALTGLPNRYLLLDHLKLGIAQARRDERLVAVFFIDIDRFKTINDSLGHSAGDQLLVQTASRFTYCLRSTDTLARLGGDEFIVVAPGLREKESITLISDKLLDSLRAPFTIESTELFITASIGVAVYPDSGSEPDGLLRDADIAMYRAKAHGGGTVEVFDAERFGEAVSRLGMETMLRRAVFDEAFVLHFQPIIDIEKGGNVVRCEALIRWLHPERGLLFPLDFIEMAETCGVMSRMTPWLLDEACRWAKRWKTTTGEPIRISINLSARQFLDSRLRGYVETALEQSGLDGDSLELEVTEAVAMQSVERMVQTLTGIKKLGARIAIDDFGTGYSSLYALRTLPIDTLKIDQSFVEGIVSNHSDAAITSTILAVANTLGLEVVAEGVETEDQLDVLARLGCRLMQGYLFSPPIPPEGIPDLLGQSLLPLAAGEAHES